MRPFHYERPQTVAEASAILLDHGPDARVLAGGTDLTVGLRDGKINPRVVVDIKWIADLPPTMAMDEGHVEVSATTAITDVLANPTMQRHFPALIEAAQVVGSIQIRNRATLVGNVSNASPAADTVPALAIYNAIIKVTGPTGERAIPIAEFIKGNRSIATEPGELVTAIRLPVPPTPLGAAFARMTRRRGVDLATINLCCRIEGRHVTIAFGAAGPRPVIVHDDSGALLAPDASDQDRDAALSRLLAPTRPISDVRASADYRAAMFRVLTRRALHTASERINRQEQP